MSTDSPLKLPIFHHTDKTSELSKLSIDWKINDADLKDIYFYNINAISPWEEETEDETLYYTSIHSNSSEYICILPVEEVKLLIQNHITHERNNLRSPEPAS